MAEIVHLGALTLPDCERCNDLSKRVLSRTMDLEGPGVRGMSAGKWAAFGGARKGRVIYISGNRWVLVEFPGVLSAYREAFFLQDLGEEDC